MKRLPLLGLLVLSLLCFVSPALATNGLLPTAVGARSAGMGGADLAIATDSTALETNPAGLIQLVGHRLDVGSGLLIPNIRFENEYNDADGKMLLLPFPTASWGYRIKGTQLATGFGIFGQGGMGASDLEVDDPVLGNDARMSSKIQMLRMVGGLAWAPHPMISFGIAPMFCLTRMDFDMPYTRHVKWLRGHADPTNNERFGQVFGAGGLGYDEVTFRLKLKNATAYGVGARAGILIMPHEMIHIGLMYNMQVNMNFNGHARMDMGPQLDDAERRLAEQYQSEGMNAEEAAEAAHTKFLYWGLESDDYESRYDAEVEMSWPREAGLGIAVRPAEWLLLGLDAKWINWAATMDEVRMYIDKPNNNYAKHLLGSYRKTTALKMKWSDQLVAAAGMQAEMMENFYGRLGYNYGNDPSNEETVMPVFAGVVEHHVSAGLGYTYRMFEINAAYEYGIPNSVEAADEHYWGNQYNGSTTTQGSSDASLMVSFTF